MPVSVGQFRFTLQQLLDHAYARCKIPRQKISAEMQVTGRENLQLALADLSNKSVMLWCQERLTLGLYEQERALELPAGTVDILPEGAFYRTRTRLAGTYTSNAGGDPTLADDGDLDTALFQTLPSGSVTVAFPSSTIVNEVGVITSGDWYLNLVFEASNDGLAFTQLQAVAPPAGQVASFYPDGRWSWYAVASPPAQGSLYFRVRETSGGTLALRELYLGNNPNDILMSRLNRQDYMNLPNKSFSQGSRPLQYWLSRDLNPDENFAERPNMLLWPVPSTGDRFNSVHLIRHRYIADVGDFNSAVELPVRWYDALIWWVASYVAAEHPDVPQERELYLAGRAKDEINEALDEERDNSPIRVQADISAYTR